MTDRKKTRSLKYIYNKLIHSHATTEEVAQGFAIGMFVSMTPTLGLHTVLTLGLAILLKKNKLAAIIGGWLNNPVTMAPIFYYIYRLGIWILGEKHVDNFEMHNIKDFLRVGGEILIPLWVGGIIVATSSAVLSYYLVKWIYPSLKRKAHNIKEEVAEKWHEKFKN